jgi:hypothetical protein
VDDEEAEAEAAENVLLLDSLVYGEEDIEVPFREGEKLIILHAAPARFGDCFDRVAGKGSADTSGDALV